jgi:integrase/recombinase XerC
MTSYIESAYRFLEHLRVVKQASLHTIRNYCIDLNALKEHLEKPLLSGRRKRDLPPSIDYTATYEDRYSKADRLLTLESIERTHIRTFLADLGMKDVSSRTIARKLASLRTFFRYCFAKGTITVNPMEDIETPRIDKKIPITLTTEQVHEFFNQPDTSSYLGLRDRAIMELFYSSGLRVTELVTLDRHNFHSHDLWVKLKGKGKKERIVPITKIAATWIDSYLNHPERHQKTNEHAAEVDHAAIFLNKWGSRLTARSVDRSFEKYLHSSGLARTVTPHTLRHTIATHWLDNGMDLKTIQQLLGHSNVATTTIYSQVSPVLKAKTHSRFHPRS